MGVEIERKFLVAGDDWRGDADAGRRLTQAYLCDTGRAVVRLRIAENSEAFLTIKSAEAGLSRAEFEYAIPPADAEQMIGLRAGGLVAKTRYQVPHGGRVWEVDVYSGENAGLVVAEIEMEREDAPLHLPPWLGREVTGEARYYASQLARRPFASWSPPAQAES